MILIQTIPWADFSNKYKEIIMLDASFCKFVCHCCKRVYGIEHAKVICPTCGLFFCAECGKDREFEKHKAMHNNSTD